MKAIRFDRNGGPEVLRWEDVPLAPHGKVMVEAARLEPIAAKIRRAL